MPRDLPWKIDWNGGQIIVHAATTDEARAKVLEYLKATNPFRIEPHQHEYDDQADGAGAHLS